MSLPTPSPHQTALSCAARRRYSFPHHVAIWYPLENWWGANCKWWSIEKFWRGAIQNNGFNDLVGCKLQVTIFRKLLENELYYINFPPHTTPPEPSTIFSFYIFSKLPPLQNDLPQTPPELSSLTLFQTLPLQNFFLTTSYRPLKMFISGTHTSPKSSTIFLSSTVPKFSTPLQNFPSLISLYNFLLQHFFSLHPHFRFNNCTPPELCSRPSLPPHHNSPEPS